MAVRRWSWRKAVVIAVFGALGLIDLAFLSSNALKIVQGGWLPLAMAATVFLRDRTPGASAAASIWKHMRDDSLALDLFLERADKLSQRIAGTAVFLSAAHRRRAQAVAAQPQALQGAA